MLRVSELKTVARGASLVFLLVAMMGPWFADSHPATEETCSHPLVWLGNGHCACLVSFMDFVEDATSGQGSLGLLCLPPALPILSTLLLLLMGERRWLWVCHMTAWGFVAIYSFFFFIVGNLYTWGDGLGGVVAVVILVGEILIARL
ncbi:MAG: hypothetical protein WAV13_11835 [Thermodesulfovibrionales bacterium]